MTDSYTTEVIRRLERVFEGFEWSQDRAIALGHMLHVRMIECSDGFVINGDSYATVLGYSDVAVILEAICTRPRMSRREWKLTLPSGGVTPNYEDEVDFVEAAVANSSLVARVV